MKKLKEFTKSERIIAVISAVWTVLLFAIAIDESRGYFDDDFFFIFCVFGVIPVLLLVGVNWVIAANKS